MKRLVLVLILAAAPAFADEPAKPAAPEPAKPAAPEPAKPAAPEPAKAAAPETPKAPTGPCAHGPNRIMFGGVDPVEQSCALAMAGQTIAEQAQQIVILRAQLAVAKSDLAEKPADAASPAKP